MIPTEDERAVYFEDSGAPEGTADANVIALGDLLEGVEVFRVLARGAREELAVGVETAGVEGHSGWSGLDIVSDV